MPRIQVLASLLCSLVLGFALHPAAQASVVLAVDFDSLLSEAEMVFEGEVESAVSQWNDDKSAIFTIVQFTVTDVLKGTWEKNRISLRFAGGTVGETTMQVSSMIYPLEGERGIYFVARLDADFIHPLLGWSQGQLLIQPDNQGIDRIFTSKGRPIVDVVVSEPSPATQRAARPTQFSHDAALGLMVDKKTADISKAITKRKFKALILKRLRVN